MRILTFTGKMSTFGGPDDTGMTKTEGLALMEPDDLEKWWFDCLFKPDRPTIETIKDQNLGLGRLLNPAAFYLAMRWDYGDTPPEILRNTFCRISANGKSVLARPADWGPDVDTGRVADLSPGVASALGLKTDDTVTVEVVIP